MDTVRRQPRGTEFGEFLRGARERRGLTLQQVSNETKIPRRHLDAFEQGDLTVVPHGMYRRAEVRAYARAVGLDQNVAISELERALIAIGLTPMPPEPHANNLRPMALAAIALAGFAGALLATWLLWTNGSAEAPITSAPAAASTNPRAGAAASPTRSAVPNTTASPARATTGDAVPSVVGTSFKAPQHASITTATPTAAAAVDGVASPAASTVPAAEDGLVVTTDPPGARVMLDGIGRGTTPLTIRFVPSGDRTLRVIKTGYISEERRIHVAGGRATTVSLTLQAAQ